VNKSDDYLYVPLMYSVGYTLAGVVSLYIIYKKYKFRYVKTNLHEKLILLKESFPILMSQLICTIKDKINYMLIGTYIGPSDIVTYDLGLKYINLVSKPTDVISTVLFPKFALSRNLKNIRKTFVGIMAMTLILVGLLNLFMPQLSFFFLHKNVEISPLRVMSIVPFFLCGSTFLYSSFFVSLGFQKYTFYSMIFTVLVYLFLLMLVYLTNNLSLLWSFVLISVISFVAEFIFKLYFASILS
jgi:PST family polysaccharide transporter